MSWKNFLETLGFNTTRWQWRWMRWKQKWSHRAEHVRVAKEHTTYQHKICDHCGALMDGASATCPRCGSRAPSRTGQAAQRLFGFIMPSWGIFSSLILFANLLDFMVGVSVFGIEHLGRPTASSLVRLGALVPPLVFSGDYWRIITYGYLHIGIIHILFNLVALFQVGPFLEREIGSARFFSVYTLSLIGGAVADLILRGNSMMVVAGASGALFGLIGFGLSYTHFLGGPTARAQRNFFLHWAIYGLIFGYFVGADNVAHLGGLITGAVLGFVIEREGMRRKNFDPLWNGLAFFCVALTLLSFVGLFLEIRIP